MVQDIRRAFVSFAWVAFAFALYSVCVVPLIERGRPNHRDEPVQAAEVDATSSTDRFLQELTSLFPAGSWELENPRVLRNQQATFLLKDFEKLDDGSLKLDRCTLIFYGDDRGNPDADRGPTVLQAQRGAVLAFDKPLDFSEGTFGNPVSGQLLGEVNIFSAGGPNSDDLRLVTSNVRITRRHIITRDEVKFRLGDNFGAGRELMLTRPETNAAKRRSAGDWFHGLGLIKLRELDRLSLQLADDKMFSELGSKRSTTHSQSPPTRVEVRCDGPLNFDLSHMIATVEKNVVIRRQLPGKPADTVRASQLSMHLGRVSRNQPHNDQDDQELALTKIVAIGNPLVIDAPSEQAYVETKRLEYDFSAKRVKLRGFNPLPRRTPTADDGNVLLRNSDHEMECPAIDFLSVSGSRELVAQGPGWYVGVLREENRRIAANWSKTLSLQPVDGQEVLKLDGKASVRSPGFGAIHADMLALWLVSEQRPIATRLDGTQVFKSTVTPHKLIARSQIGRGTTIDSPLLQGKLAMLTVLFTSASPESMAGSPFGRNVATPNTPDRMMAPGRKKKSTFHIDGGELTAWFDTTNQRLQRLVGNGPTHLVEETHDGRAGIEIHGTVVDFESDANGVPMARLQGAPAKARTPELEIRGDDIQWDGHQNRVTVPGSGSMRIEVAGELYGAPTQSESADKTQMIDVAWRDSLAFDGQIASLSGDITAEGADLSVRTSTLTVTLDRMIDLSKPMKPATKPAVAFINASGGVFVAIRGRDDNGSPESYQQISTQDLNADMQTGDAVANGPGWLVLTSLGDSLPGKGPSSPSSGGVGLSQASIAFSRELKGNLHGREAQLDDNIFGWFGPVTSWEERVDPLQVTELGENDFRISCRQVFVLESPSATRLPGQSRKPIEILARGETLVESQLYAANGQQIKYAEDKGMLTLEGDLDQPAELWQRSHVGGPASQSGKASRIRYWPKSGEIQLQNLGLDLSAAPAADRK